MLGRIFALARTVLPKLLSAIGLQRHAPASNTATVMSSAMTASAATKTASSFVRPLLSASPLAHWPLLASSRVQQPLYRIPPLSTRYGPSLFYAYASHHTFSWAAALDPKVRRQASIAILLRSLSQPKPKQFGLGPESDLNISSVSSIAPTTDTPLKPYAPQNAIISMQFYSTPASELPSIKPSVQLLSMTHIREIQAVADRHYEHMHKVSATLQKLLAAGATDIRVLEGLNGKLELKVAISSKLIQPVGTPIDVWLQKHGIDPSYSHFKIKYAESAFDDAIEESNSTLTSFIDMISDLKKSSESRFSPSPTNSITDYRSTQKNLLDKFHQKAQLPVFC